MSPNKLRLLAQLKRILPPGEVSFSPAVLATHAGDKWFAAHQPDVVVLPRSTKSVSALLRFANRHRLAVTPRGRVTAMWAAAFRSAAVSCFRWRA